MSGSPHGVTMGSDWVAPSRTGRQAAQPTIYACSLCHYPNGKGRPENASVSGLPVSYFLQQLKDFRSDLRKSAEPRKANSNRMILIAKSLHMNLAGALLIGVSAAKALSLVWAVPFVGVNHMEAHLYAALLEQPNAPLPMVVLLVSGGHTLLVEMKDKLVPSEEHPITTKEPLRRILLAFDMMSMMQSPLFPHIAFAWFGAHGPHWSSEQPVLGSLTGTHPWGHDFWSGPQCMSSSPSRSTSSWQPLASATSTPATNGSERVRTRPAIRTPLSHANRGPPPAR